MWIEFLHLHTIGLDNSLLWGGSPMHRKIFSTFLDSIHSVPVEPPTDGVIIKFVSRDCQMSRGGGGGAKMTFT